MMSKVRILGDELGNVIRLSKNPEFGYIQVEQEGLEFNGKGWLRKVRRVTNVHGTVADLSSAQFKKGDTLPGKIVIKESLAPFNEENAERDLKYAGKTGVVCRYYDQPIYRQSFYTQNINETDEFISHTNSDEIRESLVNAIEDVQMVEEELANF